MSVPSVLVRDATKRYRVFDSPGARLRHLLRPRAAAGAREVRALEGVSLAIERGESVAIIGRNGSGKSTLLQLIAGTLTPTSGEVAVNGRVAALLELGSGFNPEYSGRDNVMLNGLLLGLGRREVLERFGEIEAFADIGEAMERAVKTYSSGMLMRLAFAVQVLTRPEILIVDEALSVGDFFFQQKCFEYIRGLHAQGVTLIFVSHDMGTVRDLCSRAVYMKGGRVALDGDVREAIRAYLAEHGAGPVAQADWRGATTRADAGEVEAVLRDSVWAAPQPRSEGALIAVALYDAQGRPSTSFRLGSVMTVKVAYRPAADDTTHVTVLVRNKYNQVVTSLGSSRLGIAPPGASAGPVVFEMRVELLLETGNYSLVATLGRLTGPNTGEQIDASPAFGPIALQWDYERERAPFLGMCGLPVEGRFRAAAEEAR